MPGKMWTTQEQLSFFEALIPDYLVAQSDHRLSEFYSSVTLKFFGKWSERALRFPPKAGETKRILSKGEELQLSQFIIRRKEVRRSTPLQIYIFLS
jgi:hypothetical protein